MQPPPFPGSRLYAKLKVLQVWGANTGVGKTIVSTLLLKALGAELVKDRRNLKPRIYYYKPVSTGDKDSDDSLHVSRHTHDFVEAKTIWQFPVPVSPHIAANDPPSVAADKPEGWWHNIRRSHHIPSNLLAEQLDVAATHNGTLAIVETAGGVLSPAPSGQLQADAFRPLRLPAILVADSRLGGISATISAFESLRIRGYDVDSIIVMKHPFFGNAEFLEDYMRQHQTEVLQIDAPPDVQEDRSLDHFAMNAYYRDTTPQLNMWIQRQLTRFKDRRRHLRDLPARAHTTIWHPFLQHTERSPHNIVAIDSAYDDYFSIRSGKPGSDLSAHKSILQSAFDGSASWWTQGLGHGNPKLALEAAYAAGRYGHVMFANAIHEPAQSLAERLIDKSNTEEDYYSDKSKMTRVFYSDNGSTAMEVAVKIALKSAAKRRGWTQEDNIQILGLKNSYHGDTVGVMNCSEPNIYNEKVEWYQNNKGAWLPYPTVAMKAGQWTVTPPPGFEYILPRSTFLDINAVWNFAERTRDRERYNTVLTQLLREMVDHGHKIGALILEPVILGAGGMSFVDPLFQHCLVQAARQMYKPSTKELNSGDWTGVPVVTDEVFTGMYRLGNRWSSEMIGVAPDIRVTAKLLTGGLIPLAATITTEAMYEAFLSDDKADALLHGHSYTAHPIGCQVALWSIAQYERLDAPDEETAQSAGWNLWKRDWIEEPTTIDTSQKPMTRIWSCWNKNFVMALSHHKDVAGVFALGFVLAIEMKDASGAGYSSTITHKIRDRLLEQEGPKIHCRVLGNVLYFMASLDVNPQSITFVETTLLEVLKVPAVPGADIEPPQQFEAELLRYFKSVGGDSDAGIRRVHASDYRLAVEDNLGGLRAQLEAERKSIRKEHEEVDEIQFPSWR